MFCSDLPVKRCEDRDRALLSQLLLLFLMHYVKVCKSGQLMSIFSSLPSLVEFLNEEKSSLLKLVE